MNRFPLASLSAACAVTLVLSAFSQDGVAHQDPAPTAEAEQGGPAPSDGARAAFVANCAPCHGEKGDGKGTTQLDRPARSFLEGGFSYGNTREAIFRSMTYGIPGTPMPAFDIALPEAQRWEVADYVISLTPERRRVSNRERILRVEDKPLIARGMLPPIVDGARPTVRGLLVGLTTGTTFEYDISDMRMLGVRQGDFVERKDWDARGGDPLRPLGKVTFQNAPTPLAAEFERIGPNRSRTPLTARLTSTRTTGGVASLAYTLHDPEGLVVARVRETPTTVSTSGAAGIGRKLVFETDHEVEIECNALRLARRPEHAGGSGDMGSWWMNWRQHDLDDGTHCIIIDQQLYPKATLKTLESNGTSIWVIPGTESKWNWFEFVVEESSEPLRAGLWEITIATLHGDKR